jgi:c-di-GMP-binding flagellar brake protein YcgR
MEEKEIKPRVGIVNFEKRGYPRFKVDLPIEYSQVDSPIGQAGRVVNASEGGLLVYLPEKMEIGQHLQLKLFFVSGSELNTIEMLTEVVWRDIHLGKNWGDYRSGVKFVDISTADLNRLKDFLVSLSKSFFPPISTKISSLSCQKQKDAL